MRLWKRQPSGEKLGEVRGTESRDRVPARSCREADCAATRIRAIRNVIEGAVKVSGIDLQSTSNPDAEDSPQAGCLL